MKIRRERHNEFLLILIDLVYRLIIPSTFQLRHVTTTLVEERNRGRES